MAVPKIAFRLSKELQEHNISPNSQKKQIHQLSYLDGQFSDSNLNPSSNFPQSQLQMVGRQISPSSIKKGTSILWRSEIEAEDTMNSQSTTVSKQHLELSFQPRYKHEIFQNNSNRDNSNNKYVDSAYAEKQKDQQIQNVLDVKLQQQYNTIENRMPQPHLKQQEQNVFGEIEELEGFLKAQKLSGVEEIMMSLRNNPSIFENNRNIYVVKPICEVYGKRNNLSFNEEQMNGDGNSIIRGRKPQSRDLKAQCLGRKNSALDSQVDNEGMKILSQQFLECLSMMFFEEMIGSNKEEKWQQTLAMLGELQTEKQTQRIGMSQNSEIALRNRFISLLLLKNKAVGSDIVYQEFLKLIATDEQLRQSLQYIIPQLIISNLRFREEQQFKEIICSNWFKVNETTKDNSKQSKYIDFNYDFIKLLVQAIKQSVKIVKIIVTKNVPVSQLQQEIFSATLEVHEIGFAGIDQQGKTSPQEGQTLQFIWVQYSNDNFIFPIANNRQIEKSLKLNISAIPQEIKVTQQVIPNQQYSTFNIQQQPLSAPIQNYHFKAEFLQKQIACLSEFMLANTNNLNQLIQQKQNGQIMFQYQINRPYNFNTIEHHQKDNDDEVPFEFEKSVSLAVLQKNHRLFSKVRGETHSTNTSPTREFKMIRFPNSQEPQPFIFQPSGTNNRNEPQQQQQQQSFAIQPFQRSSSQQSSLLHNQVISRDKIPSNNPKLIGAQFVTQPDKPETIQNNTSSPNKLKTQQATALILPRKYSLHASPQTNFQDRQIQLLKDTSSFVGKKGEHQTPVKNLNFFIRSDKMQTSPMIKLLKDTTDTQNSQNILTTQNTPQIYNTSTISPTTGQPQSSYQQFQERYYTQQVNTQILNPFISGNYDPRLQPSQNISQNHYQFKQNTLSENEISPKAAVGQIKWLSQQDFYEEDFQQNKE